MTKLFRFLTSGESHGKCLNAIIEGVPAGFRIKTDIINQDLARRQVGYGRGDRMKIEKDTVEIKSGVRFGKTTGAPICLEIKNKDYSNWEDAMSTEGYDYPTEAMLKKIEEKSFTKVRPGHADFGGAKKYNFNDLRNVLERSSARKTAIEVAVGSIAKQILKEFGIIGFSHVIQIGDVKLDFYPKTYTLIKEKSEKSDVMCSDDLTSDRMRNAIDKAAQDGDTLGGKFEVIFGNLPIGLGSYVHWDQCLDGRLAQAVMSIPAIKAVEIGAGVESASLKGSQMHDEIFVNKNKETYRQTKEKLAFLKLVDGAVFSFECKMIKPQKQIYEHICQKFQLNCSECIFVDDRMENVEAARRNGILAVLFQNYEQAQTELDEMLLY